MKNSIHFVLVLSALLFGACGGSSESAEGSSTTGGEHCEHEGHCEHCDHHEEHGGDCEHGDCGHEHGEHGEHHAAMPAEIAALHEELAPVFHQDPGTARGASACEHAESFRAHATTIQAMTAPEGADAAGWTSATATLSSEAEALATDCGAGGANADARLDSFHGAFHAVMEAAGGHHEHHED